MAKTKKNKKKKIGIPSPDHFRKPEKEEAEWPPEGIHSKSRKGREAKHRRILDKRIKMRKSTAAKNSENSDIL